MIDLETKYQPAPNVSAREIEGELLLFHPSHKDLYTLNMIGGVIWNYLIKDKSIIQIINIISNNYELDPKNVTSDVISFIEDIETKGFIQSKMELGNS